VANLLEAARTRLNSALAGKKPELKSVNDQTQDEQQVANLVKGFVEEVRSHPARIANEGIWMTNIAYLMGFDAIHFDTAMREFLPMGAGGFLTKDRIHVNKILPTCQNRLARLCKNPPKFDVMPNSNEQDDKDAAELAMKVILHYWNKEQVNDKRIDLKMWCQQTGIGYVKVFWNTAAGKFMAVSGPDGKDRLEAEGDIGIDVASPFECFPDMQAKRFDEVRKFAQCKIRTLDYFPMQFPERGGLVREEGCWLNSLAYDAAINASTNASGSTLNPDKSMRNSAIEMSYYETPSKNHPRGRHIVVANGVVLKNGPLPASSASNEPAMIPFAKFDDIRIGGKYTSEAVITHARPIQDQLNRTLNQRARWTNRLLCGKYVAVRGSNVQSDAFNDQSGEIVEYTPVPTAVNGGEPHALQMPTLPASAFTEEERLNQSLNEVMGISETSKGQLASASMPAIGMQFLVEQDDTRIGVMTNSDEFAYARVGRLILKFAQCYCKTERLLKYTGPNMSYVVKKFKGDMIKGNDDVLVIPGSTLPGSKVLDRQEILTMYSQGLLGDPKDPRVREKVLSMLEYGNGAEAWMDLALDMHQIGKGIEQIEEGIKPVVDEQDNHPLWVQEINRYRKGDKFIKLSDQSKALMLQIREEHITMETQLRFPGAGDDDIPPESTAAADAAAQVGAAPPDSGTPGGLSQQLQAEQATRSGINTGLQQSPQPVEIR
jgi:hypothetical protein